MIFVGSAFLAFRQLNGHIVKERYGIVAFGDFKRYFETAAQFFIQKIEIVQGVPLFVFGLHGFKIFQISGIAGISPVPGQHLQQNIGVENFFHYRFHQ